MGEHEHHTVYDWILLFEDIEPEELVLESCPRAREAWAEGVSPWIEHVEECPACHQIARVQDLFADGRLECPECRGHLDMVYRILDEVEHYEPSVVWELSRAERSLAEMVERPLDEQLLRVRTEELYQQWGFVQRALFAARSLWHTDPRAALELGHLAAVAAGELDPESYGEPWIADLRAKAHAYVGNAHRILAHFDAAEAELALAERFAAHGVGSGLAEARVLGLKASLLLDQHRLGEALALLAHVERFYADRGERHEIGRIALQRSKVYWGMERHFDAAEEAARAAAELDPQRDPLLPLLARKNAVGFLLSAGEVERARALFETLPTMSDPHAEIRRRWVEASLLRAEMRHAEARAVYCDIRRAFADDGLHYDAALASLDLALTLHEEATSPGEVRRIAEEALAELLLADAKPQALDALRLIFEAVREDALTLAVLEHVRKRVEALRPS